MKIILEGGSTGFPGVGVGHLRIVRSVSEAEGRVQPGDTGDEQLDETAEYAVHDLFIHDNHLPETTAERRF